MFNRINSLEKSIQNILNFKKDKSKHLIDSFKDHSRSKMFINSSSIANRKNNLNEEPASFNKRNLIFNAEINKNLKGKKNSKDFFESLKGLSKSIFINYVRRNKNFNKISNK